MENAEDRPSSPQRMRPAHAMPPSVLGPLHRNIARAARPMNRAPAALPVKRTIASRRTMRAEAPLPRADDVPRAAKNIKSRGAIHLSRGAAEPRVEEVRNPGNKSRRAATERPAAAIESLPSGDVSTGGCAAARVVKPMRPGREEERTAAAPTAAIEALPTMSTRPAAEERPAPDSAAVPIGSGDLGGGRRWMRGQQGAPRSVARR